MADIFDEVMEDVKQERFRRVFEKYGSYLVTFVLLIVLFTGISVWYKDYKLNKIVASGDKYFEIGELTGASKDDLAFAKLDEVIAEGSAGYKMLAVMQKAANLGESGKAEEAIGLYNQVASDGGDEAIADLASLHAVFLQMQSGKNSDEYEAMKSKLESLAEIGRAWRFSAMELLAVLEIKHGDNEAAVNLFNILKENALSPRSMKERAMVMLAQIQ